MRRIRVLIVTLACVVGGVLGVTGATLAELAASCATEQAIAEQTIAEPALACDAHVGAALAQTGPTPEAGSQPGAGSQPDAGPHTSQPAAEPLVPRTSFATRHIPGPGESAATGVLHPATDRAMAMLVGWVLLALVGGSLLARRGTGRRAAS